MVQSVSSGGIILGGGFDKLVREGLATDGERDGVEDDSKVGEEWTKCESKKGGKGGRGRWRVTDCLS